MAIFRALVILLAVALLVPTLLMVSASLDNLRVPPVPPRLIPRFTLEHYGRIFAENPAARWVWNSLSSAAVTAASCTLLSIAAGFGFEKKHVPAKRLLFAVVIVAMTVPEIAVLLPKFLLCKRLGLYNTWLGLVAPFAVSAGTVFFARAYFRGFPSEYLDEARLAGAGEGRLFFGIVLPISGPVVGLTAIGTFLGAWNNFLWALLMVRDDRLLTVPLGIQQAMAKYLAIVRDGMPAYSYSAALALFGFLPILGVFLVFQRKLLGGFYGRRK